MKQRVPGRVSLSADHEVRLETLEHQLTRLIHDAVSFAGNLFRGKYTDNAVSLTNNGISSLF